ncbi:MAG: hypothetical protein ABSB36_08310 [Candidatus Dormibacteria bacterium]|jgi:hypothetical protein
MQRSRSAAFERQVAETGTRAAEKATETVTDLAERAVVVAREAQRVASPALRSAAHSSAETLSRAAERAAVVLADAADRLSQEVAEMPITAKGRRAAKAAAKAEIKAARPKRWRRRFRRTLVLTGVAGAVYVVVTKTPLKAKLSELVFGPPLDEEDLEPITLPVSSSQAPDEGEASEPPPGVDGTKKAPRAKGRTSTRTPKDDGAAE